VKNPKALRTRRTSAPRWPGALGDENGPVALQDADDLAPRAAKQGAVEIVLFELPGFLLADLPEEVLVDPGFIMACLHFHHLSAISTL
jgi:hypothetical protein